MPLCLSRSRVLASLRPLLRALPLALLAHLALLAAPGASARAHGRPLGVTQFFRVDGRNLLFTTRGPVIEGVDGVYRWSCSRPYGDTGQALIPNLTHTHAGSLLVGTLEGLYRRAPGACAWERADGPLELMFVGDVFALPSAGARVFAVTADPMTINYIAHSDDDGASFSAVAIGAARLQSVRVAPSDPRHVVAAGFVAGASPLDTPLGVLLTSDDAGASFETIEIPLEAGELTLVVTHLSPSNPARVWLRTVTARQSSSPSERLLRVDTATLEVSEVLSRRELRGAAAAAADRDELWVISAPEGDEGGLLKVTPTGSVSVVAASLSASCVLEQEGELYVCPIPRTGSSDALLRSLDGGSSFVRVLGFDEITITDGCSASDPEHAEACVADVGDIARDAALLNPEPPPSSASGGCAVAGAPVPVALSWYVWGLLAAALGARFTARAGSKGRPRVATLVFTMLTLALSACRGLDAPVPPDVSATVAAYAGPTAELDVTLAEAVAERIARETHRLDVARGMPLLSALVEVLQPDEAEPEPDPHSPSPSPARGLRLGGLQLVGNGYLTIDTPCPGWGADDAQRGALHLNVLVVQTTVAEVVWGQATRCRLVVGGRRLQVDGSIEAAFDRALSFDDFDPEYITARVDLDISTEADPIPSALEFDFRVLGSGAVELRLGSADGTYIIARLAAEEWAVDALNGTFACHFDERRCERSDTGQSFSW